MATNESFEIGVQISSNPIFKMADRNLANVKKYVNEHVSKIGTNRDTNSRSLVNKPRERVPRGVTVRQ